MPTQEGAARAAAGIALRAPDGRMLFVQRGPNGDYAGHWCFPGGGAEDGEEAEHTARRELAEETGHEFDGPVCKVGQSRDGVDYTTFAADVPETFDPMLDDENVDHKWATLENAPEPLHPGLRDLIDAAPADRWEPKLEPAQDGLALDRATVRSKDMDGRLHVELTNISKANVCPYQGSEIPGWRELGLDPERIYQLYRDPAELEKAAATFNNIPVLSEHVPVDARDHRPELVIGSTGTDAVFEAPYLKNSLVIWAEKAIRDIESERKKELSSAYYYTPDMTPCTVDGIHADGVMRDIVANHVALVTEGRAGADVVVGDSKKDFQHMPRPVTLSRKAAQVQGALVAFLAPRLAADAKLDLNKPLAGITARNFKDQKPAIVAGVKAAAKGKLAADATLDDLNLLLDKLDSDDMNEPEGDEDPIEVNAEAVEPVDSLAQEEPAGDSDPIEAAKEFLKGKLSDEDFAQFEKLIGAAAAADEDDDAAKQPQDRLAPTDKPAGDADCDGDRPDMISKTAMDAAIAAAVVKAKKDAAREQVEIQDAVRFVRPWVGELAMSFDSAEGVYRHTAKALNIRNAATVHASALPALIEAQVKPGREPRPTVAQDAASAKSFADRHPNAARIRIGA